MKLGLRISSAVIGAAIGLLIGFVVGLGLLALVNERSVVSRCSIAVGIAGAIFGLVAPRKTHHLLEGLMHFVLGSASGITEHSFAAEPNAPTWLRTTFLFGVLFGLCVLLLVLWN